jgi:uncharacterized protein (TIGR00288 family)
MKENTFSNIAVLIDVENISYRYLEKIFESVAAYGQIAVRRIYSDWTEESRKSWKSFIHKFSLVPIQQFSNRGEKNVSDFTLVIDAMDLLHEGLFDCFCIVSSDSDFTRLVQRIREKGKTVIGIGEKKTVESFVKACNDFIYLNDNSAAEIEPGNSDNAVAQHKEETLDELIRKAIKNLQDQEGLVQMNAVVPYLKQIKPDFNLSNYNIDGKTIGKLSSYFKNNNAYELNKDNTVVWEK